MPVCHCPRILHICKNSAAMWYLSPFYTWEQINSTHEFESYDSKSNMFFNYHGFLKYTQF